jgi:hypothetical protein
MPQPRSSKDGGKDRFVRTYAQGYTLEGDLAVYATNFRNQAENLKLLIVAVKLDLARREEHRMAARSTGRGL